MDIAIATKNKGKIFEIIDFFKGHSTKNEELRKIKWLTFKDFNDFPDVDEGSESFLENAKLKAKIIAEFTGKITLADDSGLEVDALNGSPGVMSSRYAGENATDEDNRIKILKEIDNIKDLQRRTARFVCSMVLWHPGEGLINVSTGVCTGVIGFNEKGANGFGYDPVFIPDGYSYTMAELSSGTKNKISHRAKALIGMADFLKRKNFI